jgi:hypothetical protein
VSNFDICQRSKQSKIGNGSVISPIESQNLYPSKTGLTEVKKVPKALSKDQPVALITDLYKKDKAVKITI